MTSGPHYFMNGRVVGYKIGFNFLNMTKIRFNKVSLSKLLTLFNIQFQLHFTVGELNPFF